jgi:Ca2+-binding RTX toxin-like protein
LDGGIGDDSAQGGGGDDLLAGGEGNDVLDGGDGRDTLIGGAGRDVMTGDAGSDHFVFMRTDSRLGGSVRDVIIDFNSGEDVLDLRALGISDFAAQVSTQTIGGGMILHVDLDGDGFDYADFALQLAGVSSLAAGDLLI